MEALDLLKENYNQVGNIHYFSTPDLWVLLDLCVHIWDRVFELLDRVFDLSGRVCGLSDRVCGLSDRVFGLSDRVYGLSDRVYGLSDRVLEDGKANVSNLLVDFFDPILVPFLETDLLPS